MKPVIISVTALAILLSGGCTSEARMEAKLKRQAAAIHERVWTIDTHVDSPLRIMRLAADMGVRGDPRQGGGKLDFIRMREGGLDAVFFAAYIGQGERTPAGNSTARAKVMAIIEGIYRAVGRHPALAEIALTSADADRIAASGRRAIYIGIENGYAIGTDLSNLESFQRMGVRYMTLCHMKNNDICDSSTDSSEYGGLSPFGREVVREMNRLGMIVDVSHISDRAVYDVLEVSSVPVIASHSCARAVRDNPRNLDDDLLRAIAAQGGVVQVNVLTYYVKDIPQDPARNAARETLEKKWGDYGLLSPADVKIAEAEWDRFELDYPQKLATVADFVDHIDHIVRVAGIDHVGIGTDFDGGGGLADCFDASELGNITLELVRRGYSEADIAKIWGGNFLRVFRAVEAAAEVSPSATTDSDAPARRLRDLGVSIGEYPPGPLNALTDVPGVLVGQVTLFEGSDVRTGVTAIRPHSGNLYRDKVPAAIAVGNAYGKLAGYTQVEELGELETPIVLTNTLSVPTAAAALIDYTLSQPGNETVRSVNPVVGETNDGWLNDIRGRRVRRQHVLEALATARSGPVAEGAVGAGTGTLCLGFKGGIGSASRLVPIGDEHYRLGVLVQSNFGGHLRVDGVPVERTRPGREEGSCMIVIATDAPLDARNLKRLARRAFLGLGRAGGTMSNGSGEYAIAFSTAPELRIAHDSVTPLTGGRVLRNDVLSPLFAAMVEATEEAVVNSLLAAVTVIGRDGHRAEALPVERVLELLRHHRVLE